MWLSKGPGSESACIKTSGLFEPMSCCLHSAQYSVVCFPHLPVRARIRLGVDGCLRIGCTEKGVSAAGNSLHKPKAIKSKEAQKNMKQEPPEYLQCLEEMLMGVSSCRSSCWWTATPPPCVNFENLQIKPPTHQACVEAPPI